jgi:hypothetical protein
MSQNAEAKAKMRDLNNREWEVIPDLEKNAVRAALKAYSNSPGDSINMAMLRGIRAYQAVMGLK